MREQLPTAAENSRESGQVAETGGGAIDFARYIGEQAAPSAAPETHEVRFSHHDGLRGWLEAKSRHLGLYGAGFIELRANEVVLGGWERNWLGVAQRTELFIPLQDITDAIQGDGTHTEQRREGEWVRFRYETALGRYRFVEFQTASIQQAADVIDALPKARSATFDRWTAIREFDTRLREAGANPWMTTALVIANVLVFLGSVGVFQVMDPGNVPEIVNWGVNYGPLTLHGQWWRLLNALFLHANPAHLFFNMYALWNVGRWAERLYGNWVFVVLYLACGVLSGLASLLWDPTRATLGASGAIFGICAAFVVFALHPHRRIAVKVPPALWISTSVFFVYNLVAGFLATGIDNAAHVGGLISGLVLGICFARPLTVEARQHFPVIRLAIATALTAVAIAAAFWQTTGFKDPLTGPERYFRDHDWYLKGETENLRTWMGLQAAGGPGLSGSGVLAERFEREVVPFWETTVVRLKREQNTLPPDEDEYGQLMLHYVETRLDTAHDVLAALKGDEERALDAQQDGRNAILIAARAQRLYLLGSLGHESQGLIANPWIVAIRNLVLSRHWTCAEPQPWRRNLPGPKDSPTDGPALRHAAGCRAQKLFVDRDYLTLDRWLESSSAELHDLPDGSSTFEGIIRGLDDLFDQQMADPSDALRRTLAWQRRRPKSVYPKLLQSCIFRDWAWAARGVGSASSVGQPAWVAFTQRTEMADAGLREFDQLDRSAHDNPLWYQLKLDVGLDETRPRDELREIFDRAVFDQPGYRPVYTRMLRILMQRWLGSREDLRKFILDVAVTADGQRDFAKYALLYWIYSSLEDDEVKLFDGTWATWSVVSAGFEELLHRYPNSDLILNSYAKLACMANDKDVYSELRPLMRDHVSSVAWAGQVKLERCDKEYPAAAAAARGHRFTSPRMRVKELEH